MAHESIEIQRIIQALRRFKSNVSIASAYQEQIKQVRNLLKNDSTGFVNTILDFQIHAATVPFKIETGNDTLNSNLKEWQTKVVNKDINIDIPRGLRELSSQYFRERWTTSFIALRVKWDKVDFGGENNIWEVPVKMWFVDGASIHPHGEKADLSKRTFFLNAGKTKELKSSRTETVIIRKPFGSWYEFFPIPYLIKRGVVFNALIKQAILTKQADVITQIIPYLLLMQAGSQQLAEMGVNTTGEDLKAFKDTLIAAIKEHDYSGEVGKLIAAISGDVKVEHFIPDLTKLLDSKNTSIVDKNMLAGLGMIELQGFSNTRKEALLNPQPLVQEVTDAVADWVSMLQEVMYQMLERNQKAHRNLSGSTINIIPGRIKPFISDAMKRLIMNGHDRGDIDTESYLQDVFDLELEAVLNRRDKERKNNVEERLSPRQTQWIDPSTQNDNSNQDEKSDDEKESQGKKPGTPEANNFKAEKIEKIDELSEDIKKVLPVPAQLMFLSAYNKAVEEGNTKEDSEKASWVAVKKKYKKTKNKWVKK